MRTRRTVLSSVLAVITAISVCFAPSLAGVAQAGNLVRIVPGAPAPILVTAPTPEPAPAPILVTAPTPEPAPAPQASQLRILPGIADTPADGASTMVVTVEVLDQNGNLMSSDNATVVSVTAAQGAVTLAGGSQPVAGGVATFRLRSDTPGTYQISATTAGATPLAASAAGTFTPIVTISPIERPKPVKPPALAVDPLPHTTTEKSVTVSGRVAPGVSVTVTNGTYSVAAPEGEAFSVLVPLNLAANRIVVLARDQRGLENEEGFTVTRIPAPPATIQTGGSLAVEVGSNSPVSATVYDTNGDPVPDAQLSGTVEPSSLGTYQDGMFAAGTQPGAGLLTLRCGNVTAQVAVTVLAGALATIKVAPAEVTITGQEPQQFSAVGADRFDNSVPLTSVAWSSPAGAMDASGLLVVSPGFTGDATVTAQVGDVTGTAIVHVVPPQVLSRVGLTTAPELLAGDGVSTGEITLHLQDQTGVDMVATPASAPVQVHLSISNPSVAAFADGAATQDVTVTGVTATVMVRAGVAIGTAEVTGTAVDAAGQPVPVGTASVTTTIMGVPYKVQVQPGTVTAPGAPATITLWTLDYIGNHVTTDNRTVYAKVLGQNGLELFSGAVNLIQGTGQIPFTAPTMAGTYTVTVADQPTLLGSQGSYTVVPGPAAQLMLSADPCELPADGAATAELTATIVDAYGNVVPDGQHTVTFTKTVDNGATQPFGPVVVPTVQGKATASVKAAVNVGADSFTAEAAGFPSRTVTVVTKIMGVPYRLTWLPESQFQVVAGSAATVVVGVQDALGQLNTGDNGRPVTVDVLDGDNNVITTATGATVHGKASVTLNVTRAGTFTLQASSGTLIAATTTFTVYTGIPAGIAMTASPQELRADGSSVSVLTVRIVDAYGNPVSFNGTVNLQNGNPGALILLNTSINVQNGSGTAYVQAGISPGDATITASADGLPEATLTIHVASLVAGSRVVLIADSPVISAAGDSVGYIAIHVRDGSGNEVSGLPVTLHLTSSDPAVLTFDGGTASLYLTTGPDTAGVHIHGTFQPGTATVNGTVIYPTEDPIPVDGATVQTVLAGPVYGLKLDPIQPATAGGTVTAIVRAVDFPGNPVTTPAGTFTAGLTVFGLDGATVYTGQVSLTNGVGKLSFPAPTIAGAYSAKAELTGLAAATGTFTVTAGQPAALRLAADLAFLAADGISESTLTATVTDAYGNPVDYANGVTFAKETDQSATILLTTGEVPLVNGQAAARVRATYTPGTDTYVATAFGGLTGSVSITTGIVGPPVGIRVQPVTATVAGGTVSVTLWAVDAMGNHVTSSYGTLQVDAARPDGILMVATLQKGTSRVEFTAPTKAGTYPIHVLGTVTWMQGEGTYAVIPANASQVILTASPDVLAADGVSTGTLTATIADAYGNRVHEGQHTVTFVKTGDGGATKPFAATEAPSVDGRATVTVTASVTPGTDTYSAQAAGLQSGTATVTTKVMGMPYQLGWLPNTVTSVTAGNDATVAIGVEDAFGQVNTGDSGRTVTLKVLDGTDVVTSLTGATDHGTVAFTLHLTRAGAYTLQATATDLVTASSPFAVLVGPLAGLALTVPEGLIADGVSTGDVTIRTVDAFGNTYSGWYGLVDFRIDGPSLMLLNPFVYISNSVGTASVQAKTIPGDSTITVTASGLPPATATVHVGTLYSGARIVLSAEPATLSAAGDSKGYVAIHVRDKNGMDMPAGQLTPISLALFSSNPAVLTFIGGTAVQSTTVSPPSATMDVFATTTSGTSQVTGTAFDPYDGTALPVDPVTISTTPTGPVYGLALDLTPAVQAGTTVTAIVRAVDFMGHPVTTSAGTLTAGVTAFGLDGTPFYIGQASLTNGSGTVTFSAPSKAGAYSVKAAATGLSPATGAYTVTPGAPVRLDVTADPDVLAANGVSTATLTATLVDAYGNAITGATDSVTFAKGPFQSATTLLTTGPVPLAGGKALATVRANLNQGTDTYTATAQSGWAGSVSVRTAIIGFPAKLLFPGTSTFTGNVATYIDVPVVVADALGTTVTTDNGRPVTVTVADGNGWTASYTGTTVNGKAVVKVNLTQAGTYTITATADGLTPTPAGTLTVTPGGPAVTLGLMVGLDRPVLEAAPGSAAIVTVRLIDQYGNLTPTTQALTIHLATSNTQVANFSGPTDLVMAAGASAASATLSAGSIPGTATITASSQGIATGSAQVTTQIAGPAYKLSVAPVPITPAGGRQLLTVSLVDGRGTEKTADSTSTIQLTATTGTSGLSLYVWSGGAWVPYTPGDAVRLDRGQVQFAAQLPAPGTVTYMLSTSAPNVSPTTVTGTFTP